MRVTFFPSGGAWLFGTVDALRFRRPGGEPLVGAPHGLNLLPYVATRVGLALACHSVTRWRLGVPAPLSIASDGERR
jgi:ABC-type uncharacterized transport system permease subunit